MLNNFCVFYLIVNMCIITIVPISLLIIIFIPPPLSPQQIIRYSTLKKVDLKKVEMIIVYVEKIICYYSCALRVDQCPPFYCNFRGPL